MLTLLIFFLKVCQAQRLDIVTPSTGSACAENRQCATLGSCPYWIEKDKRLNQLPQNSDEKRKLIKEFKSAICNKQERGLCCPIESPLDLVEATDQSCSTVSKCATRDSCQFWKDKSDRLGKLRGTREYSKLRDEIVSAICNKKRKALCCPIYTSKAEPKIPTINDSPSYLPIEGECGINPHNPPSSVSILIY